MTLSGEPVKPSLLALMLSSILLTVVARGLAAPNQPQGAVAVPERGSNAKDGSQDQSSLAPNAREWITAERPQRVELRPGTAFVMAPNSRVLRLPMIPGSLGGKDSAKSAFSVELVNGRIDVDIDPALRPIYGVVVRAPRKIAAVVKAGQATVAASAEGVTVAARSSRDMMIGLGERWRPLRSGKALTVSAATPDGEQRDIIAAPNLRIDNPLALTMGQSAMPQRLSWSADPQSRGGIVRLCRRDRDAPTLIREQRVEGSEFSIGTLPPGQYSATVSAVDRSELQSSASRAVDFFVVEAKLPPGAQIHGTTIRLPAAERLRFSDTSGLELSYAKTGNDFVPAPPSVGLHEGAEVTIRLRLKGTSHETSLSLKPLLQLAPQIQLGPTRAVWPGPAVKIVIQLPRLDGDEAAEATQALTARVTVNGERVEVPWQREDGTLKGQVEQPPTKGPWVVRVEVSDREGRTLARDFLEVEQNRSVMRELTR